MPGTAAGTPGTGATSAGTDAPGTPGATPAPLNSDPIFANRDLIRFTNPWKAALSVPPNPEAVAPPAGTTAVGAYVSRPKAAGAAPPASGKVAARETPTRPGSETAPMRKSIVNSSIISPSHPLIALSTPKMR